MKSLLYFLASFTLLLSQASYAASTEPTATDKQTDTEKQATAKEAPPTIEELLAEKHFVQGDVARRIRTHTIDTWRYLDKYHIYIDGVGKNNNYLVKFRNQCRDTRGSESIFYKTHNGALTKFDTIGVIDSIGGHISLHPTRSCFIEEIYRLDRIEETADGADTTNTEQPGAVSEVSVL